MEHLKEAICYKASVFLGRDRLAHRISVKLSVLDYKSDRREDLLGGKLGPQNKDRAGMMGVAGRRLVEEKYSWGEMAERVEKVYREMVYRDE